MAQKHRRGKSAVGARTGRWAYWMETSYAVTKVNGREGTLLYRRRWENWLAVRRKQSQTPPPTAHKVDPGRRESRPVNSRARMLLGEHVGPREKERLPPTWPPKDKALMVLTITKERVVFLQHRVNTLEIRKHICNVWDPWETDAGTRKNSVNKQKKREKSIAKTQAKDKSSNLHKRVSPND